MSPITSHIEHVVPRSKGGASALQNVALACPGCNLRKASKVLAVDPETGDWVPLFHPIREVWAQHFRFNSYEIEGLTATGRATIGALDVNRSRRQPVRKAEEALGLFPPIS